MKKNIVVFCFFTYLILSGSLCFAQSVGFNKAKEIAKNHLIIVSKNNLKSASSKKANFQFNSAKVAVENKDTLYYILNDTINKGFVIVSADQRAWPILGYSLQGIYDEKKQPDAFVAWMDAREKEIAYIIANDLQTDVQTVAAWEQLKSATITTQSNGVGPLLTTKWNQGCYYNEKCPVDAQGYCGGHVPTGCVATAMAQIMKYWNYPTTGKGSHSYELPDYGTINADFGSTTYQWNQMPNIVTEENDAVATLMFHCGVADEMYYSSNISGANEPSKALVDYFDYSPNIEYVVRDDYYRNDFVDLLKDELNLGHPIYYEFYTPIAHALICDGYQDTEYFHLNWGWGGNSDGYYYIGNMNKVFDDNNSNTLADRAIIKIFPNKLPDGYNGIFLSANKLNLGAKEGVMPGIPVKIASSANWTVTCDKSWVTLSSSSGNSGNSILTLTVTENHDVDPRTAIVTISAEGFSPQMITVNQLQVFKVEAGGLHDLFLIDLATITNLTLDGTMDARDFRTLRDEMPKLAKLDLSGVQVVGYTGIDGTAVENTDAGVKPSINVTTYPEDVLPISAFQFFYYSQDLKPRLKSVILPSSITTVGQEAFFNCRGLISVIIPTSVVEIEHSAFYNCRQLASVDFPPSLTSIGYSSFLSCDHLFPGTIPSTVALIGTGSFANIKGKINVDPNNPNYSSLDGVLYSKDKTRLMQCPTSVVGNFTIPSIVKTIEPYAFLGDYNLTSVIIPQSVVTIEAAAFSSCGGLKIISLPSSIKSIGAFAFENCYNVDTIISRSIMPIDLSNSALVFKHLKKDLVILKVPFGSKAAYQAADQWKDFMNIVEMPGFKLSATTANLADTEVSSTTLEISSDVTWSATSDQSWLTVDPITGTGNQQTVMFTATEANTSIAVRIAAVTISADGVDSQTITVTQSGSNVPIAVTAGNLITLFTAEELATITKLTLTGTIDARDFKTMRDVMPLLIKLDLSDVKIVEYTGTEGTEGINNITYPANAIPSYAFRDPNSYQSNSTLESVIFPSSVNSIGYYAFFYCNKLNVLTLPNSVNSIDNCAFFGCISLTTITLHSSIKYIGAFAFQNCVNVDTITANSNVPINISNSPDVFNNLNKDLVVLLVPAGSKAAYQSADQWKDFQNIMEMPEINVTQSIFLNPGWNIMSFSVMPEITNMTDIFQSLIDEGKLVKIQDESGNSLEDWGIFGGWQNNIGNVSLTEGYKIKVNRNDTIQVSGSPVEYPFVIPLKTGWNIAGYPQLTDFGGMNLVQQLLDKGILIKVQDEGGNSIEDWGIFGGWQNNIGNFAPGEGYKIKVNADDTLWIYNTYPKSSPVLMVQVATTHFQPEFEGNGVDHMNINLVSLPTNMLKVGDELAVFDGTTCVGAVTLMSHHIKNQSVSITTSAKDNQGMAGFGEGNQFTLKLWKSRNNQEFILEPEIVKGTSTFTKHETTIASLEKYATTSLEGLPGLQTTQINCYPNPFSDEITVDIKLSADAQVQVDVLNQLGQRVKTIATKQLLPRGLHKLEWDGRNAGNGEVAPGIYHVRIEIDGEINFKKVVYSKIE